MENGSGGWTASPQLPDRPSPERAVQRRRGRADLAEELADRDDHVRADGPLLRKHGALMFQGVLMNIPGVFVRLIQIEGSVEVVCGRLFSGGLVEQRLSADRPHDHVRADGPLTRV